MEILAVIPSAEIPAGIREILQDVELKLLKELPADEQMKIRLIRNQEAVRMNMYNIHIIDQNEHLRWLERLKTARDVRFFAIYLEGVVIGAIGLSNIDETHKRADWGFYIDANARRRGLGSAIEFAFLDYAFGEAGLEKLNGEVLGFNEPVMRLHKKFGFLIEGVRRNHILRDGKSIDVQLIGITKAEWEARRQEMLREEANAAPVDR